MGGVRGLRFESVQGYFLPYEYINITDDADGEVQTQLEGEDTRKCLFCLKYRGGGGGDPTRGRRYQKMSPLSHCLKYRGGGGGGGGVQTQLEGEDTRKRLLCLKYGGGQGA